MNLLQLRQLTSARVAIGRVGHSLPTAELLNFQFAHAGARDAVWTPLDPTFLAELNPIHLNSQAPDRPTYLRRPDLGRRLDPASRALLQPGPGAASIKDAAIIVADGLSAQAVHHHAQPVIDALHALLTDWNLAPLTLVQQGRVAISDEIGHLLNAQLALILIGERPGLGSPDSLGAYLTWNPQPGRTDAERLCVSNIRTEGLAPALAAQKLATLMREARTHQVTGVALPSVNVHHLP